MSDHDRKVLWARVHNRCAICGQRLIADATPAGDRESIVGEEAHIASPSRDGPRGGEAPECDIDAYGNRILLCRDHHRILDDQPNELPVRRLRQLKADRGRWAEQKFGPAVTVEVRPDSATEAVPLVALRTGDQVWELVADAHAFLLDAPKDGEATVEQCDAADLFLGLVKDWGDVAEQVIEDGPVRVRAVKRQLHDALTELHSLGSVAYGARRRLVVEGGALPPAIWWEGVLVMRRKQADA